MLITFYNIIINLTIINLLPFLYINRYYLSILMILFLYINNIRTVLESTNYNCYIHMVLVKSILVV